MASLIIDAELCFPQVLLPGVKVWRLPLSLELKELGDVVEEGEDDQTDNVYFTFEEPALKKKKCKLFDGICDLFQNLACRMEGPADAGIPL